jgi:hypothetical protein
MVQMIQLEKLQKKNGAIVLIEKNRGYGNACLKGIQFLKKTPPDIVVFLDGDFSDFPQEIKKIIKPIEQKKVDFVIGSRIKSLREKGSMTPQQIFGNKLACFLLKLIYGGKFTDLGPFRAIKWDTLMDLNMIDKTYGWTIEMQLKVLRKKISYAEAPVRYRRRIGNSKISGTLKGSLLAGIKIIGWIVKYYFKK